ncbi:MAG: hypothetical protein J7L32_02565 [Thermoplasmata archaeon]|nr:hypothetical protein [Thermoplasmata archaeon]
MVKWFGVCLSMVLVLFLVTPSLSSLALSEEKMKELEGVVPPGFPINNSTEVKVENGTVWIKTRVDPNNWSFPSLEEVMSRYTHKKEMEELSKELDRAMRETDKALRGLDKTMKDMEEIEEESEKLNRMMALSYLVLFMILLSMFVLLIIRRSMSGKH